MPNKNTFELCFLFLIGFAGFSQLSYRIVVLWLGSPVYLMEPFLVLLLLYVWRKIKNDVKSTLHMHHCMLISGVIGLWWLLVVLALTKGSLGEALSSGRPYIYAFFAAFMAARFRPPPSQMVFVFLCGIIVGEIVNAFLSRGDYGYRGIVAANVIAVFAIIALSIVSRKVLWQVIAFVLVALVTPLAGFRFLVLSIVVALVFAHTIVALRSSMRAAVRQYARLVLCVLFLGGVFALVWQMVDVHEFASLRLIDRTMAVLHGDVRASQDTERLSHLSRYLRFEDAQIVFPKGFIMRAEEAVGIYNDAPFLYFTETFGFMFGFLLIILLFTVGFGYFIALIKRKQASSLELVSGAFLFLFCPLILLNGRFLYIVYESVLFGWLIGKWFSVLSGSKHMHSKS